MLNHVSLSEFLNDVPNGCIIFAFRFRVYTCLYISGLKKAKRFTLSLSKRGKVDDVMPLIMAKKAYEAKLKFCETIVFVKIF